MTIRPVSFALILLLASCKPPEETRLTAVIGAVLIDGTDAPPLSRSVLVIAGSTVRWVGEQASTPVPAAAEKHNGAGRFLIPAPVAIPASLPSIRTLAEAITQVDAGAIALSGMIGDTEQFDESLLKRWRDLQLVIVPNLHELSGTDLARAQRNVKKLAAGGMLIGAGDGPQAEKEWLLLEKAGLSPAQVLTAATRNAARAAKQSTTLGSLAPGMTASLWLLDANPLESAANLSASKASRIMIAGQWMK